MPARPRLVAVCGASQAGDDDRSDAAAVGRLLAERGFLVVCGGGTGVATAVAAAVHASGGTCIGLLPGDAPEDAASGVTIPIATGVGHVRNALIARSCDALIAIGGGYGTLSEIAFGLILGKPVVALNSWRISPPGELESDATVHPASTPEEAVEWVERRLA
ncbi:MAG: LOG family protein [Candidatus Dormiibacterota bacterium]